MNEHGYHPAARTLTLSWHDIHRDLIKLARQLDGNQPWQGIVAVTRGGLVPAAILARALDIRLIETICLMSYQDRTLGPIDILKKPERAMTNGGQNWLIIDDIVDTGATVKATRELLPKAVFATIYVKPPTRNLVDLFLHEADPDTWIEFPWEREG